MELVLFPIMVVELSALVAIELSFSSLVDAGDSPIEVVFPPSGVATVEPIEVVFPPSGVATVEPVDISDPEAYLTANGARWKDRCICLYVCTSIL